MTEWKRGGKILKIKILQNFGFLLFLSHFMPRDHQNENLGDQIMLVDNISAKIDGYGPALAQNYEKTNYSR